MGYGIGVVYTDIVSAALPLVLPVPTEGATRGDWIRKAFRQVATQP